MATVLEDLQTKYAAVRAEIQALHDKGPLEGDDAKSFGLKIVEAKGIRAQIDAYGEVGALDEWASRSAGVLPMAGRAHGAGAAAAVDMEGFTPAGATTFYHDKQGALRQGDSFGDGIFDPAISASIATPEYKQGFRDYLRLRPNQPYTPAMRALSEGSDTAGGFLVPPEIMNKIIAKEPTPTRVAGRVTNLTTSRDNLAIPKVNYATDDLYSTGMRVTWTGEVPSSSTAARVTDPLFGQVRVPIYTAMMSILVTNDIIEDSMFDLLGWLAGKFGETYELLRDNMVLNGTGVGQPAGILSNPGATANPAVIVTGQAATLGTTGATGTANTLFNKVAFSIPEQYEENLTWVMNKTNTAQTIAQLVDGNGRLLWGSGLQDSGLAAGYQNRMLVGYPVTYSGFMPNIGASTYPIVFGDLRGYYLVNRIGFSVQVFREIYAETNQVLVLGRCRFGGLVAEDWKVKIVQCHT